MSESKTIVSRVAKKHLDRTEMSSKNFHIVFNEAYDISLSLLLQSLL